jgi:TRAP-type C4-dicarboxylate transport system permease small subunit
MMRKALDCLYTASGVAAAFFLVAIFVIVLAQVGANSIDYVISMFAGRPLGLVVPSYAEIAGFFLAAASFLALPYAMRHGSHIRVTLVLMTLPEAARRVAAVLVCAVGAMTSAYFAYYAWQLVIESHEFGDLSPGLVAVPLWIPQMPIAIGASILAICLVDSAIRFIQDGSDAACDLGAGSE